MGQTFVRPMECACSRGTTIVCKLTGMLWECPRCHSEYVPLKAKPGFVVGERGRCMDATVQLK